MPPTYKTINLKPTTYERLMELMPKKLTADEYVDRLIDNAIADAFLGINYLLKRRLVIMFSADQEFRGWIEEQLFDDELQEEGIIHSILESFEKQLRQKKESEE